MTAPYSPPVRSKRIDMRTLVAAIDPSWRSPVEVYLFPNGRRFLEDQSAGSSPAPTPVIPAGAYYTEDGSSLYYTSADPTVYYLRE